MDRLAALEKKVDILINQIAALLEALAAEDDEERAPERDLDGGWAGKERRDGEPL